MAQKNEFKLSHHLEEIKKLCDIDGLTSTEIAKKFKVSDPTARSFIIKNEIKLNKSKLKRKYFANWDYFKNIDSKDKAYFLGLLMADGCVYLDKRCNLFNTTITLQAEDLHILETYHQYIESTYPVNQVQKTDKNTGDVSIFYTANVNHNGFAENLIALGCTQRKSLTMLLPTFDKCPEYLYLHFLRGLFDGDGSICIGSKNNKFIEASVGFSINQFVAPDLAEKLEKFFGIKAKPYKKKNGHCNLYFGGRRQILKFFEILYQDCEDLKLNRKYNKFISLKNFNVKKLKKRSSDFFGVYKIKEKFLVLIDVNKKTYRLGWFENELEAAKIYNDFVIDNKLDRDLNLF